MMFDNHCAVNISTRQSRVELLWLMASFYMYFYSNTAMLWIGFGRPALVTDRCAMERAWSSFMAIQRERIAEESTPRPEAWHVVLLRALGAEIPESREYIASIYCC